MLLFSCEYGSRAMGMSTELSDHDIMEVHLEPREYITGMETWNAKHTSTSEGRSGAGDTDTTVYGLHHWATLAAKGNPTVMTPLFVTEYEWGKTVNELGNCILVNADLFISKDAGRQYWGYAKGQRDALLGMRNKKTNRPELVHTHGYDTKFAYHALRTLVQGAELMNTGWLELPIAGADADILRSIRNGEIPKDDFIEIFSEADVWMEDCMRNTDLPEHADRDSINALLHEIYLEGWEL